MKKQFFIFMTFMVFSLFSCVNPYIESYTEYNESDEESQSVEENNSEEVEESSDGEETQQVEEKKNYKVYWYSDGYLKCIKTLEENSLIEPYVISKEGYNFIAWTDASGNDFDFSLPITSDCRIYAKWEIITFNVKFYNDDGSVYNEQTVNYGKTFSYPSDKPTSTKYKSEFQKWICNEDETIESVCKVYSDLSFNPKYRIKIFTYLIFEYAMLDSEKSLYSVTLTTNYDMTFRNRYATMEGWENSYQTVGYYLIIKFMYMDAEGNEHGVTQDIFDVDEYMENKFKIVKDGSEFSDYIRVKYNYIKTSKYAFVDTTYKIYLDKNLANGKYVYTDDYFIQPMRDDDGSSLNASKNVYNIKIEKPTSK